MYSDWFNGIVIFQGRWQHREKVGYCYPSGLENTLCKWDIYVPLVTKGLIIISLLKRLYFKTILPYERDCSETVFTTFIRRWKSST